MKASDLLAILEHNDPGVLSRVHKVKQQLKQLELYEKCASCAGQIHFEYRRTHTKAGNLVLVERGTCQGCFAKIPAQSFLIN
jgi:predicted  nucleic acid-binding Zn-ribbon protein